MSTVRSEGDDPMTVAAPKSPFMSSELDILLILRQVQKARTLATSEEATITVWAVIPGKGTDLLESNFYGYLEAQARFGRFSAIYGGPPCKTVSFCRFGHDQDGGPPPLNGYVWNDAYKSTIFRRTLRRNIFREKK